MYGNLSNELDRLTESSKAIAPKSFEQQIRDEIFALESVLERKRKMLELLERNPDIKEFMNLSRGF